MPISRARLGAVGLVVAAFVALSALPGLGTLYSQSVPANARPTFGGGWVCNEGWVKSGNECVTVAEATDTEIRQQMIQFSLMGYSGNCPCPYNVDRAGRRCGGRSAWSRPGGASPLCYEDDIAERTVEVYRDRFER